jgi:cytochrome c biogenesis protein CcmG, thiol:disulfide interchange protein DsbE
MTLFSKKKIGYVVPFALLFSLLSLLGYELFYNQHEKLPSALIGEPVPSLKLPSVFSSSLFLTNKDIEGKVSLLNFWATWCYACGLESDMLLKISRQYHIKIYGVAYKDNPQDVKEWLQTKGNPYVMTALDLKGDTAIDLGVYGTPETFVIDSQGKIIYRHVGVITQATWDKVLYPLIQKTIQHEKTHS